MRLPASPALALFDGTPESAVATAAALIAEKRLVFGGYSMVEGDGGDDAGDPSIVETEVERIAKIAAREKSQGIRKGTKDALEALGFSDLEAAKAFITAQRQAAAAAESDAERRARELTEREAQLAERERAANERAFNADVRAALVTRGCTDPDDLADASALLLPRVDRTLTGAELEAALNEAADSLKTRRAELFGGAPVVKTPKPPAAPAGGGAPAGNNRPPAAEYGAAGRARAAARFAKN